MSQSQRCARADCDKPRYQGKAYCLDHYKEQESYSYGMDAELKAKQDAKYDPKKEAEAQAWIEAMLGERFPDSFHESLKSGVRLCQVMNKIWPGSIHRINTNAMPFTQRENISNYLDACRKLGMAEVDLFVTVNLFEATNMGAVVQNIFALGALARKAQNFQGPYLGVKLADKNVREFTPQQLAESKAFGTRQTQGSYGYEDKRQYDKVDKIIQLKSGGQASQEPSRQTLGSYGFEDKRKYDHVDKIIQVPQKGAHGAPVNAEPAAAPAAAAAPAGGAKFCPNCGQAADGGKFCGGCGAPL